MVSRGLGHHVGNALLTSANRTTVCEGEYMVSDRPEAVFTAVLGSCIAACLHDPVAGIGGMNHFLLAGPRHQPVADEAILHRYGVHAMEILMNALLAGGATRATLRAHIYGGANMHQGMRPIGEDNAAFARRFLSSEAITIVRADVGGTSARRVEFRPAVGLVRSRIVHGPTPVVTSAHGRRIIETDAGEVTLF